MNNICKFVPTFEINSAIIPLNFVLEKEWDDTKAIVCNSYMVCLVTDGKGVFSNYIGTHSIAQGDLFFIFQSTEYTLLNEENLEFVYVSFAGCEAATLLNRLGIAPTNFLFHNQEEQIDFWLTSLTRATRDNIELIALSVLYNTLSFIPTEFQERPNIKKDKNSMLAVKEYLDSHFWEPEVSVHYLSDLFGYNKSYLSTQFKKISRSSISDYLTELRLDHAKSLIEKGYCVVYQIAEASGYNDPQYFSKQFKKKFGYSPLQMIRKHRTDSKKT